VGLRAGRRLGLLGSVLQVVGLLAEGLGVRRTTSSSLLLEDEPWRLTCNLLLPGEIA